MFPLVLTAVILLLSNPSFGQSLNVDFGSSARLPADSYDAVGIAGFWNDVAVLPPAQRMQLTSLDGTQSLAKIYMIGGTDLLVTDDPLTFGDDEALLDDMLIGFNDPLDVCVWFEGLQDGDYDVIVYAMTPKNPTLNSRVRVDFSSPGPQIVGGAWPGTHQEGITYARHTVTVSDGTIGLHSGLLNGLVQSGINGVQLVHLTGTDAGTLPDQVGSTGIRGVFPNPSAGPHVIELDRAVRAGSVAIHDVSGRLIWQTAITGVLERDGHRVIWDGHTTGNEIAPPGVYFVKLTGTANAARLIRIR